MSDRSIILASRARIRQPPLNSERVVPDRGWVKLNPQYRRPGRLPELVTVDHRGSLLCIAIHAQQASLSCSVSGDGQSDGSLVEFEVARETSRDEQHRKFSVS